MTLADRLAATIRAEPTSHCPGASKSPFRSALGIAWSYGDDLGADALVARADQAMYESKRERAGLPKLAMAA